jgi:hypothetical protein
VRSAIHKKKTAPPPPSPRERDRVRVPYLLTLFLSERGACRRRWVRTCPAVGQVCTRCRGRGPTGYLGRGLSQMNVTWRNYLWSQPRRAAPGEIESLEKHWGVILPDDYRNALAQYQGMSPRPNAFDVGRGESAIAALLIISPDEQHRAYLLTNTYAHLKAHVPNGIYPIAVTGAGDYVCLDYRESAHTPKIVFYFSEESGEEALYPIADNFSDFLARLHD